MSDTQTWQNFFSVEDVRNMGNVRSLVSIALQSQYSHSEKYRKLGELFNEEIDASPELENLYKNVLAPEFAYGRFLDWWGKRVGVSRNLTVDGVETQLDDDFFRFLIFYRAVVNISNGTSASINSLLTKLSGFPCRVFDNQDMTINVSIFGKVGSAMHTIIMQYGLLNRPAGVLARVMFFDQSNQYLGFQGSELYPFNQGTFYDGDGSGSEPIPEPEDSEMLGIPIGLFLGDVDENGVLQAPSENAEIDTGSLVRIEASVWRDMFKGSALVLSARFRKVTVLETRSLQETFSGCANFGFVIFNALEIASEAYCLYACFYNSGIVSVEFPELRTISGQQALQQLCYKAANLKTISMPKLETVGYGGLLSSFRECAALESISFPALKTVNNSYALKEMCYGCTALKSASFPVLEILHSGECLRETFRNCNNLESVDFRALKSVNAGSFAYYAFYGTTRLTRLDFPLLETVSRTDCFNDMLTGSSVNEIHFPAAMQSVIESQAQFATCFGRGEGTVQILFDL